jgi:hypothetical protein
MEHEAQVEILRSENFKEAMHAAYLQWRSEADQTEDLWRHLFAAIGISQPLPDKQLIIKHLTKIIDHYTNSNSERDECDWLIKRLTAGV